MTREELDFIGSMNMCDEISNDAYKKIVCHCEEQEPCEDAISRQAVIDACEQSINLFEALDRIKELTSVTPQPKTGQWVYKNGIRYCEYCGASNSTAYASYCPNCGAKMVEPQESEDWVCKGCWCDDGEVHVECVFCDKIGGEE